MTWFTYIVRCADDSLYTGVCTDVQRRIDEHNSNTRSAARYTRARQPVELVYCEAVNNRSEACKREAEIRKLNRQQKLRLVRQHTVLSD